MARRKKEKKLLIDTKKEITYSGNVILKKVKNGKVVSTSIKHNTGNSSLFEFLLNCLAGVYDYSLRPKYITPVLKNENTYTYATSNVCSNINEITVDKNKLFVEYKFYLDSRYDYQLTGIDGLALYCQKYAPNAQNNVVKGNTIADNYSMIVLFDENQKLEENEGLIVIWQLSIINN